MFLLASSVERFGPVLLVLPLLLVARVVRRLPDRPDRARLRRSARAAIGWLALGGAVLVAWAAAVVGTALAVGADPRVGFVALLLAVAATATVRGPLPLLLGLARSARPDRPVDPAALADEAVARPARLLPVAAAAAAVLTAAAQTPVRVAGLVVLALVAVIVAVDVGQRARRLAGRPPTLRWPARSRLVAPLALVLGAAGCGLAGAAGSALPADLVVSEHSGHAGFGAAAVAEGPTRDVADLVGGPPTGPVRPFTLVADEAPVVLASGAVVDAWTFGGSGSGSGSGSGIRVTEGDVVDVRLINRLDTASTTVHWHGIDVPNAMDGVAGVTQDAVPPGGEFSYRFPVARPGTYWFHAHQDAGVQVARGLFGAIVVEPRGGARADVDETVLIHDWPTRTGDALAFGTADRVQQRAVRPGSAVRLRVVNTESSSQEVRVTGALFRLAALDGTDLHGPGELTTERIVIGGGGRADLILRMPEGPVRLATGADGPGLVLSPDGRMTIDSAPPGELLDITRYGRPAPTPFGPADGVDRVDREHRIRIGEGLGFSGRGPDYVYTINDQVWPDVAPLVVREGELVRVTVVNAGLSEHPMHLHGHHVLVLRRDGRPASGSPLWLDTLLVRPGETWQVAFRADNPGVWMDHCHILFHATSGMMMHVQYEGVRTSFDAGAASGNVPE